MDAQHERRRAEAVAGGRRERLGRDRHGQEPEHRQLGLGYRGGPLSKNLTTWDGSEAGDRAPWLEEIGGGGFTLLGFGAAAGSLGDVRGATTRPMPGEQDVLVLVRPDGYIGVVAGPTDVKPVQDYIDCP